MRKPDPKNKQTNKQPNKQIELPRLPHSANRLVESVYPPPPLKGAPAPISGNAADVASHLCSKPALDSPTAPDGFDAHDRAAVRMVGVVAEGRAAAGAGAQGVRPFRGEDTFVVSEAVAAGLRRVSLGMESCTLAECDSVSDMLVAENASTSDWDCQSILLAAHQSFSIPSHPSIHLARDAGTRCNVCVEREGLQ